MGRGRVMKPAATAHDSSRRKFSYFTAQSGMSHLIELYSILLLSIDSLDTSLIALGPDISKEILLYVLVLN
jgi:hypothetical protein